MRSTLILFLGATLALTAAVRADEAPRPAGDFELRTLSIGPKVYLLRFKPATGEVWTSSGAKWTAIADDPALPAGSYDVTMAPTEIGYAAVRWERRTGSAWMLRDGKWTPIAEPESAGK